MGLSAKNHQIAFNLLQQRRHVCILPAAMSVLMILLLSGCGSGLKSLVDPAMGVALIGLVRTGQQPVANSTVQLYAMGTSGDGSASTPLLAHSVQTDSTGAFTISETYSCPSADTQIYVAARGGNPAASPSTSNAALGLMAALGKCGSLGSTTSITVNEVTTVGSIWPLSPFAKSALQVGSSVSDLASLDTAVGGVSQLVSTSNGVAVGSSISSGPAAPSDKLNTLADIIGTCINSNGGSAGDGTACGKLFYNTTVQGSAPPSDTIAAAISIASHPTNNVAAIYNLLPSTTTFQPVVASAPSDWSLTATTAPVVPSFSPASGNVSSGSTVTIASATASTQIHYTVDGSTPTATSPTYSSPISVTQAVTLKAVAVLNSQSSDVATASYKVAPTAPAISPGSGTLTSGQSVKISSSVAGTGIYYTTDGSTPTQTSATYTAPIKVTQSMTVKAVAVVNSVSSDVTSASYQLPPVAPVITPGSSTLTAGQTVAITDAATGAQVHYTTDGSAPTASSPIYAGPIAISQTETVKAVAVLNGLASSVVSATFSVSPAMPSITPGTGTFLSSQLISITDTTAGVKIRYTTDGSTPTTSSTRYSAPISVSKTTTIHAIAVLNATISSVATATYSLAPASPSITPGAGTVSYGQAVMLTDATAGVQIHYTTDGTAPSASSAIYSAPISLTQSTTIKAIATLSGTSSAAVSATYTVPPVAPAITPGSSAVSSGQSVTITESSAGAQVHYTLDGSTPTASSAVYAAPIMLTKSTTVNAIAVLSGLSSSMVSNTFTVSITVNVPLVHAASADAFVDSIGVNVHFGYYGSIYTNQVANMMTAIKTLGVRHLRDQMNWEGSNRAGSFFYQTHQQLATMGVKTEFQMTSISQPVSEATAFPALVDDMEAVEPWNENDGSGGSTWAADTRNQQAQLYAAVKGNAATKNLTVIAASLAQPYNAPQLGDISSICDVGDSHAYFQGWNPGTSAPNSNNTSYFMNWAAVNVPSKPVWVTETGFWSQQTMYWGGAGNGEALMATYSPRALLEFWNAGAQRTYLYELADFISSDSFGLIRTDGTLKPAFNSVANLLNMLAEPGASFTPGSLAYNLTGTTSQVHQTLLQKSDGSYYLVLWIEASGMDVNTLANINVPNQTVTVNLGQSPSTVTMSQWDATGAVTTKSLAASQALSISVGSNITVLRIK